MRFETNRLILREFRHEDFGGIHEILSDEDTMKHYPHPFNAEETRHWIQKNMERYIKDGFGLWAVEMKENGQLIGDCGITMQNIHGNLEPEIGYHINKKYQKQGYATEAAAACIRFAFNELKFTRVYSYMKYTNEASARVAMKNGMQFIEEYEDPVNIITKVYAIFSKRKA
jgi:RimJ/RimL family protein N-acetyltransferase